MIEAHADWRNTSYCGRALLPPRPPPSITNDALSVPSGCLVAVTDTLAPAASGVVLGAIAVTETSGGIVIVCVPS